MKKISSLKRKPSPYKVTDKVRVRKSYYTFSEEYPVDRFQISRRKRLYSKRKKLNIVLSALLFTVLLISSFFVMNIALNISGAPINPPADKTKVDTSAIKALKEDGIRALYMPSDKLSDKEYVKDFIREIRKKNGNSVVIDFKNAYGKLAYTSLQNYAIIGKCNHLDNDTARKAIDIFTSKGITVIARIYCFEDPAVAETFPAIAVKYMDTDVNWRDNTTENGNGWLNPVSKRAKNYLYGIMEELYAMNIRGFMLESVQFPDGLKSGATYPGEKESSKRNEVLKSFVSTVRKKLPKDALLIVSEGATDAAKGNESIYFGSMSDVSVDAVAADTRERNEEITVNRKEKFTSVLSMYGEISKRFTKKIIIPVISTEEYSRSYIRAMKKNGYTSYILIDENGKY
ncbi:MAG: hypothetical protein II237_05240 [Clostridia bacterium]|nr:hypothetical protein [Clostridia bacterium]